VQHPPDHRHEHPGVETDPRFPSGPWLGFWLQRRLGKQKMSLSLTFIDGRVTGSGSDVIGRFDFSGSYDLKSGRVVLTKQYAGAHRVDYQGANQDDGMWLWGIWRLPLDRGGWHLWPEAEDDPTRPKLNAEKQTPKPDRVEHAELVESNAS
jgi:hypothetical protein